MNTPAIRYKNHRFPLVPHRQSANVMAVGAVNV